MRFACTILFFFCGISACRAQSDSTRWYMHSDAMIFTQQASASTSQQFISLWFDSAVLVGNSLPFASAAQVIDPSSDLVNEPLYFGGTTMGVCLANSYRVDSILFRGAYIRNINRPDSIVDTLVISVAPQTGYYSWGRNDPSYPWVVPHLHITQDTLKAAAPLENSLGWLRYNAHPDGRVWTVAIDSSLRQSDTGIVNVSNWLFEIPGGPLNIPAGYNIAVTIAFKTGDIVTNPNIDSIQQYHHFLLSSKGSSTDTTTYLWYALRDQSMSALMHNGPAVPQWTPTIALEGAQGPSFAYEYHDIAAHVKCSSCGAIGNATTGIDPCLLKVPEIPAIYVNTYPNPADQFLYMPFKLNGIGDVTITLSNVLGQTIATQKFEKTNTGKAEFSTLYLAPGLYFYTLETNAVRTTGRVLVAH